MWENRPKNFSQQMLIIAFQVFTHIEKNVPHFQDTAAIYDLLSYLSFLCILLCLWRKWLWGIVSLVCLSLCVCASPNLGYYSDLYNCPILSAYPLDQTLRVDMTDHLWPWPFDSNDPARGIAFHRHNLLFLVIRGWIVLIANCNELWNCLHFCVAYWIFCSKGRKEMCLVSLPGVFMQLCWCVLFACELNQFCQICSVCNTYSFLEVGCHRNKKNFKLVNQICNKNKNRCSFTWINYSLFYLVFCSFWVGVFYQIL